MAGGGSNLVVASLAFFGAMRILTARPLTGGPLLGAAAALKLTPLLFPALLFACRRRLGATIAVVSAGAGLLAPALVLGPARFVEISSTWAEGVVGFLGQDDLTGERGAIIPFEWMNQSLRNGLSRYLTVIEPTPHPAYRHFGSLSPDTATWIFRAVAAALLIASGLTLRSAANRGTRADGPDAGPEARSPNGRAMDPLLAAAWCGWVFLVMLLLSPISWRAHYVAAIPALFVASAHAIAGNRGRWTSRAVVATFVLLAACTNETFWGKSGKMLLQAHYTVTIAAVLLFVPLARVLLDPRAFPPPDHALPGPPDEPSPDPPSPEGTSDPRVGRISPDRSREK